MDMKGKALEIDHGVGGGVSFQIGIDTGSGKGRLAIVASGGKGKTKWRSAPLKLDVFDVGVLVMGLRGVREGVHISDGEAYIRLECPKEQFRLAYKGKSKGRDAEVRVNLTDAEMFTLATVLEQWMGVIAVGSID